MAKGDERRLGGNEYMIDGKVFSIGELVGIVESLDSLDELRFNFSGGDYCELKRLIEKGAGLEMGERYGVSREMKLTNQGDRLVLERSYTVVVGKVKSAGRLD